MRGLALRVVLVGAVALCLPATAQASWTSATAGTTATMTSAGDGNLIIDQNGGLLRHNRDTAGDANFDSDFDFSTASAGNQTFSSTDPSVNVVAIGDGGSDTAQVGSAAGPAGQLVLDFTFTAAGGTDTFIVENTADATSRSYQIGSGQIAGHAAGAIAYSNLENLTLNAGGGGDQIALQSAPPPTPTLNTGGGADQVTLGNGVPVPTLDGQGGVDMLSFGGYTGAATFTLGAPTVNVENLTGGPANDTLSGDGNANRIEGAAGADSMAGGAGDDLLAAVDGTADASIDCGPGDADVADVDGGLDPAPVGCETVNSVGGGPPDPGGGGADSDGDGVPDAQDRCPDRAAPASGCPEVERNLTLDRKRGAYKGKLETIPDTRACEADQKVAVFRKKKGDDKKLGNDRTSGKGAYEVDGSGKDGKYYATVKETDEAPEAVCLGAKSKNLKVD